MEQRKAPTLEVIIPVFNEQAILEALFARLSSVFSRSALDKHQVQSAHFIFVDDGSHDDTARIISERISQGFPGTLFRFSRNFGHQSAVTAGLEKSNADLVAIIDADLQDPPEVILEMVGAWRQGYDVIYGVRKDRKENFVKVFCYWAFYRLLRFLSDSFTAVDSGDFCLLDRRVVDVLRSLPEKLRFPRGLRSWIGFRQIGFPYARERRVGGSSKYNWKKLYQLATDGIASSSTRPLKIAQWFSTVFLFVLSTCVVFLLSEIIRNPLPNGRHLWFLVGYLLTSLVGLTVLVSLHILCGYVGRMYLEVKGRPNFIIMESIDRNSLKERAGREEQRRAA